MTHELDTASHMVAFDSLGPMLLAYGVITSYLLGILARLHAHHRLQAVSYQPL